MNPSTLCMMVPVCIIASSLILVMVACVWRDRVTTMTKLDKFLAFAAGALPMLAAMMSLVMLFLEEGDLSSLLSGEAFCLLVLIPVSWGIAVLCTAKLSAPATEAEGKERIRRSWAEAANQSATKPCPFQAPRRNFSKFRK